TGFVGRAVTLRLLGAGHRVAAIVRSVETARSRLGGLVELFASAGEGELAHALDGRDAVINLAGEPIIGRWTAARKERIVSSRVNATRRLVATMASMQSPPRVLVSASAVGYYGDRGDEELTE